jgi:hypothetical protein
VVVTGEADQLATVTSIGAVPAASVGGPKSG